MAIYCNKNFRYVYMSLSDKSEVVIEHCKIYYAFWISRQKKTFSFRIKTWAWGKKLRCVCDLIFALLHFIPKLLISIVYCFNNAFLLFVCSVCWEPSLHNMLFSLHMNSIILSEMQRAWLFKWEMSLVHTCVCEGVRVEQRSRGLIGLGGSAHLLRLQALRDS